MSYVVSMGDGTSPKTDDSFQAMQQRAKWTFAEENAYDFHIRKILANPLYQDDPISFVVRLTRQPLSPVPDPVIEVFRRAHLNSLFGIELDSQCPVHFVNEERFNRWVTEVKQEGKMPPCRATCWLVAATAALFFAALYQSR